MTKKPVNHGKPWTNADVNNLRKLTNENTPTPVIGLQLGRSEDSIRSKAYEKGLSLKPTNQSPYNRRNK